MEIFVVGGAVRNVLMGRPVNDMDYVVVGSTPEEMFALGYIQVGADFPVFLHPETGDEYALARTERKKGKGYHGFTVNASPTITLEEDLSRRDLTINAMAVRIGDWPALVEMCAGQSMPDRTEEWGLGSELIIIDPFDGKTDLQFGLIRPVLLETFVEDPLRVVRAARFAATYNMAWTVDMYKAAGIVVASDELKYLPPERYSIEIEKVLTSCETAGQVAAFVMHMTNLGLMDECRAACPRMLDSRTSLGAKLQQLFVGSRFHPSVEDFATAFGLPGLISHQLITIELVTTITSWLAHAPVDTRMCNHLYDLVDRLRKAPKGGGLEFVEEFLSNPGTMGKGFADGLRCIKQMNQIMDEVRFSTHVGDNVAPKERSAVLRRVRIDVMVETAQ